jgi:hypothetical protein
MAETYEKIATTTLGSATATVTFSSISGAYTDLVLVVNYGGSVSDTAAFMQFNGDTGSNYSNTKVLGNGSVSVSQRNSNLTYAIISDNITSTTLTMNCIVSIQNYSNTTTYKTSLGRYNLASGVTEAIVNLWRNTSAITQIVLDINAGNFITGSTFTLYGILKAA